MRVRQIFALILVAALLLPVTVACGADSPPPTAVTPGTQPTEEQAPAEVPTTPVPATSATPSSSLIGAALQHIRRVEGTPLAIVEGEEIFWEDYQPSLYQALRQSTQQGNVDWNDPAMSQRLGVLQNEALQRTVDRWLVRQLVFDRGIDVTDEQVDEEIQKMKDKVAAGETYPDWESYLSANGYTEASMRQVTRDTLLMLVLMELQEIDTQSEQVLIAHIVTSDGETAQELVDRLKAGDDFAEVAAEYSEDEQTKDNGGELGWFSYETILPELAPAVSSLQAGEFSDPIKTRYGYSIIKILKREVREADPQILMRRKEQSLMAELEARRATAQVEYLVDFTQLEANQ